MTFVEPSPEATSDRPNERGCAYGQEWRFHQMLEEPAVSYVLTVVGAAETVADVQEEVVEFTVQCRVGKVVDHARRLPSSRRRQFSMSFVGGAVRQDRP
jgi:hypothetical protein